MKHLFLYLTIAAGVAVTSCSSDEVVEEVLNTNQNDKPIGFVMNQKNITRATMLQTTGHYNFGVFGYKSTDATNPIMANYLVGYNDATGKKGYYMTTDTQTTLGDKEETVNGQSYWAYEKMGSADYTYAGADGFYTASQKAYMSNVENQYLRYWDNAAATTSFYAYSPYINGAGTATYDNSTKVLNIPDGSLVDGYDDASMTEYMFANTTVNKSAYGNDVVLSFKRLNAKVNLKFYETLEGYSVKIIDLGNGFNDVQATPAILSGTTYSPGSYFQKSGFSINFSGTEPVITAATGTTASNTRPLVFKEPTADQIGTSKESASPSPTTYYAIPKSNSTGFTFHVSYELTSTTGEKITVRNATVHVPYTKCNWAANTAYTYVFKITEGTNGSTDPTKDSTIDPTSPSVDDEKALYPIVFDGVNVEEWKTEDPEFNVTEGTNYKY